jgi:hypothetical protein
MLIDDIFMHLLGKSALHEWTSLEEYYSIMMRYGPDEKAMEAITGFLEKYFVDIDEQSKRIRFNSWTMNLLSSLVF